MNGMEHFKKPKHSKHVVILRLSGKTAAAFQGRLSCNSNSHTAAGTVQMNQLRTCTAGILAEIPTPDYWKMT